MATASWTGQHQPSGSNVTGILTDTGAVAALLHARGALSFRDYAGPRAE